jgi:5-methylcytosine-specific restriction enzyme subunit McrC
VGKMKVITFEEENPLVLPANEFNENIARMLYYDYKNRISVEFPSPVNENSFILRSNGYIGYIPLDENFSLRITPKVPILNVFGMLEYAYKLKSFSFLEGSFQVDSIEDLFERLANILAKRVLDRSQKGLFRDYLQRNEKLPYLRGRIRTIPTTISVLRGSTSLECEYQENTADLEDNQILAWTLYQLRRFKIQREDVKRRVNRAFRELVNKVSINQIDPRDCVNRLYHRLNQDYKPIHGLCRFFLDNCGPGLGNGEYNFIPFIVHMPNLFELFVAEWLLVHLPKDFSLKIQYRAQLDSEGKINFKIDLVIIDASTGITLGVLDTKYKHKPELDEVDIQQIVAYSVSMDTDNAFLIYPSPMTRRADFKVGQHVRVRSLVFNIGQDLDLAGENFLNALLN